jgi:hypothetical protein
VGSQSIGSVTHSSCSQRRLQNPDTVSLAASAWSVSEAIVDGDLSEESDGDGKEDDDEQGEDSDDEDNEDNTDGAMEPVGRTRPISLRNSRIVVPCWRKMFLLSPFVFLWYVARAPGESQRKIGLLVPILMT